MTYEWTLLPYEKNEQIIALFDELYRLDPTIPAANRLAFIDAFLDPVLNPFPAFIAVAKEDGRLKTLLPLTLTSRKKYLWRWTEWCTPFTPHASLHMLPNCRNDEAAALFDSLFEAAKCWPYNFQRIVLRWVQQEKENEKFERAGDNAWFDLKAAKQPDDIVSHKLLKNLQRLRKRLVTQSGDYSFNASTSDTVHEALCDFIDLEQKSWRGQVKCASIASDKKIVNAYQAMMKSFSELNQARVYRYSVGSILLAAAIGFQFGDVIYLQSIAFSQQYGEFAPGNQLLLCLIEKSLKEGDVARISLSTCPEWSKRWHPNRTPVYNLVRYRGNLSGYLLKNIVYGWRDVKEVLRPLFNRMMKKRGSALHH